MHPLSLLVYFLFVGREMRKANVDAPRQGIAAGERDAEPPCDQVLRPTRREGTDDAHIACRPRVALSKGRSSKETGQQAVGE